MIPFTKMHGLGNDFVVIDQLKPTSTTLRPDFLTADLAQRLCDRRFGVGADQILVLRPGTTPHALPAPGKVMPNDATMEIINSDGSVVEMCGNGIRAVGLYLDRYYPRPEKQYRIGTLAGLKIVDVHGENACVDMGPPQFKKGLPLSVEKIEWSGKSYEFYEVGMGNPHAIFFVDQVANAPVDTMGPFVEIQNRFPQRTNVEFVEILSPTSIKVRVWERGSGITLACGTGACASAVASLILGKVKQGSPIQVNLPGGALDITWRGEGHPVIMEGPAKEVFSGTFFE